jgi:hypothetical protein
MSSAVTPTTAANHLPGTPRFRYED